MGSWDNYFRSVGRQNNNNILIFRISTSKIKNIDDLGKETYTAFAFALPTQNKNVNFIVSLF